MMQLISWKQFAEFVRALGWPAQYIEVLTHQKTILAGNRAQGQLALVYVIIGCKELLSLPIL